MRGVYRINKELEYEFAELLTYGSERDCRNIYAPNVLWNSSINAVARAMMQSILILTMLQK